MKEFEEALKDLERRGLLRTSLCIESSHGTKVTIDGCDFTNFCSNDYLNLSQNPSIVNTAKEALETYGFGSGSSRLLSGTSLPHRMLEERIAGFKGTEAAILFNSGYAANTGIIPAIAGTDSVIFSDELNHASIIDGIRLSKADTKVYRHRDPGHLEELLKASLNDNKKTKRLIITDSVFSMDGDIAPLKDIHFLVQKYGARLMIDDAHAVGVMGETGRGGLEHFNLESGEVIQMGTLSKALGCFGAYAAGPKKLIDYLINKSRSYIFSTSLPPSVAAAAIKAFDIIDNDSSALRTKLISNAEHLRDGLKNNGFDILGSESQIVPILLHEAEEAMRLSLELYKKKILALPIRPPSVPQGMSRIRFSVTAEHSSDDIDKVIETVKVFK